MKIAERLKAIDGKSDKEDQKHSPDKREVRPTSDKLLMRDQGVPSLAETPFDPRMDEHALFLAAAPAGQSAANYILQLQRTYGNRYVQRLVQSMDVQAELSVGESDSVYEPEVDGTSVPRIQGRTEKEKTDRQVDDVPGILRWVEAERASFTEILQRQGAAAPPKKETETGEADAELDALRSDIDRRAPTPEIPPFEVISGTTTAGISHRELVAEIERSWVRERMDFTTAARIAARRNITARRGGPRPTQSPEIKPAQPYSVRWALSIGAANYRAKGYSKLMDIRESLKRGSPFRKSLAAGFANVIPVNDPTAAEMEFQIRDAILGLYIELGPSEIGELVVFFTGHGAAGHIIGVDGKTLQSHDLKDLAQLGEELGIHLVYILDTCRAGPLVALAQQESLEEIGEKTTKLPDEEQKRVQSLVDFAKEVSRLKWKVCTYVIDVGDAERKYRRKRNRKRFRKLFQALVNLSNSLQGLRTHLTGSEIPEGIPSLAAIIESVEETTLLVIIAMGGERKDVRLLLRKTAVLLDKTNDFMNELISQLTTKVSGGPAAP